MRTVDLSTKETYLAWVQEWRQEWHSTVSTIRGFKALKARAKLVGDVEEMNRLQGRRQYFRTVAHALHMDRLEGKRLSWEKRCEMARQECEAVAV